MDAAAAAAGAARSTLGATRGFIKAANKSREKELAGASFRGGASHRGVPIWAARVTTRGPTVGSVTAALIRYENMKMKSF